MVPAHQLYEKWRSTTVTLCNLFDNMKSNLHIVSDTKKKVTYL